MIIIYDSENNKTWWTLKISKISKITMNQSEIVSEMICAVFLLKNDAERCSYYKKWQNMAKQSNFYQEEKRHVMKNTRNLLSYRSKFLHELYEPPRRKPGWRFTAGFQWGLSSKNRQLTVSNTKLMAFYEMNGIENWSCCLKIIVFDTIFFALRVCENEQKMMKH